MRLLHRFYPRGRLATSRSNRCRFAKRDADFCRLNGFAQIFWMSSVKTCSVGVSRRPAPVFAQEKRQDTDCCRLYPCPSSYVPVGCALSRCVLCSCSGAWPDSLLTVAMKERTLVPGHEDLRGIEDRAVHAGDEADQHRGDKLL